MPSLSVRRRSSRRFAVSGDGSALWRRAARSEEQLPRAPMNVHVVVAFVGIHLGTREHLTSKRSRAGCIDALARRTCVWGSAAPVRDQPRPWHPIAGKGRHCWPGLPARVLAPCAPPNRTHGSTENWASTRLRRSAELCRHHGWRADVDVMGPRTVPDGLVRGRGHIDQLGLDLAEEASPRLRVSVA